MATRSIGTLADSVYRTDPADIELPPTEPIDITEIMRQALSQRD